MITFCQSSHFPENAILKEGATMPRKRFLLTFNPFIDCNGFLRVNRRLSRSPTLTYDEPLHKLFPHTRLLTRLYWEHMQSYLQCCASCGKSFGSLDLIRTVIHNCKICTIFRKNLGQQIMSSGKNHAISPSYSYWSRPCWTFWNYIIYWTWLPNY